MSEEREKKEQEAAFCFMKCTSNIMCVLTPLTSAQTAQEPGRLGAERERGELGGSTGGGVWKEPGGQEDNLWEGKECQAVGWTWGKRGEMRKGKIK